MLVYLRQFFLSVHFLVVQLVPPILVFRLVICKFSHFSLCNNRQQLHTYVLFHSLFFNVFWCCCFTTHNTFELCSSCCFPSFWRLSLICVDLIFDYLRRIITLRDNVSFSSFST